MCVDPSRSLVLELADFGDDDQLLIFGQQSINMVRRHRIHSSQGSGKFIDNDRLYVFGQSGEGVSVVCSLSACPGTMLHLCSCREVLCS